MYDAHVQSNFLSILNKQSPDLNNQFYVPSIDKCYIHVFDYNMEVLRSKTDMGKVQFIVDKSRFFR